MPETPQIVIYHFTELPPEYGCAEIFSLYDSARRLSSRFVLYISDDTASLRGQFFRENASRRIFSVHESNKVIFRALRAMLNQEPLADPSVKMEFLQAMPLPEMSKLSMAESRILTLLQKGYNVSQIAICSAGVSKRSAHISE